MRDPHLDDGDVVVYAGDCIEVMRQLPEASVDAIVTDPPYGLEFMGRDWDGFGTPLGFQTWTESWAREAFRVLKPGGHLLAFAGTRTYHRMASGVEDAGFEIRDCIAWMYGSGFPKSLDVSKAIDKAAGAQRTEKIGPSYSVPNARAVNPHFINAAGRRSDNPVSIDYAPTAPATDAARKWSGWGTALKPAFEPVVVARKPLVGTVAQNVLEHGTGAINVDGCRIGTTFETWPSSRAWGAGYVPGGDRSADATQHTGSPPPGRWPANVTLDETAAAILDEQAPNTGGGGFCGGGIGTGLVYGEPGSGQTRVTGRIDANGGASRFFYTAKASRQDRNVGGLADNTHPTVKPTDLMRWLIRLVTPPGGIILDPFGGSGSTGVAARSEGVRCILIEREPEYLQIISDRLKQLSLFGAGLGE